ncbi:hypothetical protein G6O67_008034 [Ophiocordyceps sinensis]|uniref:Uncharacterized protein n=1 Tax=Ophiocordyceps sinensis TaxID=72228 RepID=A0A8H4LT06_9HYPO|nr:hypothetical protein G6O67_008034 [Ophiocordyceps sinensis]
MLGQGVVKELANSQRSVGLLDRYQYGIARLDLYTGTCFHPSTNRLSPSIDESPAPARNMAAFSARYSHLNEEKVLNLIWVGLLSVEVLMIVGVAVKAIARRLRRKPGTVAL